MDKDEPNYIKRMKTNWMNVEQDLNKWQILREAMSSSGHKLIHLEHFILQTA